MKKALVVTSISKPSKIMEELAEGSIKYGFPFICVGDRKSPENYHLHGCDFLSLEKQYSSGFSLATKLPESHYARKNIGYLEAIAKNVDFILETDDDNLPLPEFWDIHKEKISGLIVKDKQWANAYSYFTDRNLWPRGFPLEQIKNSQIQESILDKCKNTLCPVQQGLANGDTDVDAIFRFTNGELIKFNKREPLIMNYNTWCPFNSQSTVWWRRAFQLMYLPSYCSFRMTDIWRSFVTQACLWSVGWRLAFIGPIVSQHRNYHNLLKDFEDEIPGYLHNAKIIENLEKANLVSNVESLSENMLICYEILIKMDLIDARELELLEAWHSDILSLIDGIN